MKRLALILVVLALMLAPLTACTTTSTADNPPVVTSLTSSPSNVAPGGSSTITCVASDPESDILSYTWSATGGTISGVGNIITWVAPAITGVFTISVTVADDETGTATASCYVAATETSPPGAPADNPPVITSLTPSPSSVAPEESSTITCVASDPDGDTLSYTWSATNGTISGVGNIATWVAPAITGTFTISMTVADGGTGTATASCFVAVETGPEPTATPSSPSPWPMEITDDLGRTVVVEKAPQHIVSLAPSNTEILFAIDLGDKVKGVTDFCDYPQELLDKIGTGEIVRVGSTWPGFSLETIVSLVPDIAFAIGMTVPDYVDALESLGIPVVMLEPHDIAGIFKDIELVGEITGNSVEAEALINNMKAHMAAICTKTATATSTPKVFYEVDGWEPSAPWTAGSGTFIDTLITLAAGENIANDVAGWYQINLEVLTTRNPEIIILGDCEYGVSPEIVMARPGWGGIAAVINEAVFCIDTDLVSRPAPRIFDGLEALARLIHPELFD